MSGALLELAVRVLCDTEPLELPRATYLYAQTIDNESSVFAAARALARRKPGPALLIPFSPARDGYPGYPAWRSALESLGIPSEQIVPVPAEDFENLNTRTEAIALVRYLKAENIRSVFITASPLHQIRAVATVISVALDELPELAIFSFPGPALPWTETAVHSQGIVRDTRSRLIASELERIERYQAKGDLKPTNELLEYLDRRGS